MALLVEEKPSLMMLKDYLNSDFGSCSSNGFKSFPRRQCCNTTVRFLLDINLNQQRHSKTSKSSFSSSSFSAFSTLQKAVINAVKLLPLPSSKSSSNLLPRSFSRKLFKKSFRKKIEHKESDGCNEIEGCRLFRHFLEERDDDDNNYNNIDNGNYQKSISQYKNRLHSASSTSNSWTESEFSGSSDCCSIKNGTVAVASDVVGVTTAKEWASEEDKEQFSPVSVLDCPFQDEEDEDEISSPLIPRKLNRMKGAKQKLVAKIVSFENLAQLEPVNLENQIELANSSNKTLTQTCSLSEDVKADRAQELLGLIKTKLASKGLIFKVDGILLDFLREKIVEANHGISDNKTKEENNQFEQEIEVVEDWINGKQQEKFLGWEVKENRHVYVEDMERYGKWEILGEEKEELVSDLEFEIFTSLVNEALLNILS